MSAANNTNVNTSVVYTSSSLMNMLPNEPSICVPRIYMNIEKERVIDVFGDLFGHGSIERVDMIERTNKNGEAYKRAFIHFKFWPRTSQATEVRLKLLNGEEVKVVYDQPWYWRISASRIPRPEDKQTQPRHKDVHSRPYIMIDEDDKKREEGMSSSYYAGGANQKRYTHHHRSDHAATRSQSFVPPQVQYQSLNYYRDGGYHRSQKHQNHHSHAREHDDNNNGYNATTNHHTHHHIQHQQQYHHHQYRPQQIRITPTKEPEIASWINDQSQQQTKVPGAPRRLMGRKPRLVLDDNVLSVSMGRKLNFDEETVHPTTSRTIMPDVEVERETSSSSRIPPPLPDVEDNDL